MPIEFFFPQIESESKKRALWVTDTHFDAVSRKIFLEWCQEVKNIDPDLLLVGGDVCNGFGAFQYLKEIALFVQKPLYFVLGNHEFYYGSITKIRGLAAALAKEIPFIHYLPDERIVELTPTTALIGHDGWADARAGNFRTSSVILNDYLLIDDFKDLPKAELEKKLNILGDKSAHYFDLVLRDACLKYSNIIVLTHVPPFQEACFYEKKPADTNWSPHFVNQRGGEAILNVLNDFPERNFLVLCGHSHNAADIRIRSFLRVIAAESILGKPQLYGQIFLS